jgi:xanthine/uracil/vitamin C permease (AzgA family)
MIPAYASAAALLYVACYALCKVLAGRIAEAKPAVLVLAALFAVKFAVSG